MSPLDYITSTGKDGKVRFDPRKTWEAGAFIVSTGAFGWMAFKLQLTEFYFIGYMGAWVGARFLRDREQRLNKTAG